MLPKRQKLPEKYSAPELTIGIHRVQNEYDYYPILVEYRKTENSPSF
jgi:hypothetical protein